MSEKTRLIVGMTGASGAIYGTRLLRCLRSRGDVEIHLVLSDAAERTCVAELDESVADIKALAHVVHSNKNIGASIASGSFRVQAMIIAPCSIKTMSEIAHGLDNSLIVRAADVTLKERRPLVLMVRESHFHLGHLRTMVALTEIGAIIAPPAPAFYYRPSTILDLVDHNVERMLDLVDLPNTNLQRWDGRPRQSDGFPRPSDLSPEKIG